MYIKYTVHLSAWRGSLSVCSLMCPKHLEHLEHSRCSRNIYCMGDESIQQIFFKSTLHQTPCHVYTRKIVFTSWSLWSSFLSAEIIIKYIEKWMKVMYSSSQGMWDLYRETFFFKFFDFSWRLITLQYYSCFCHTLIWISHGFTCAPHPEAPSHFPPYPIPLGHPSAPALSTLSHASNLDWWSVSSPVYDNIHLSMLFSQIIPPSPFPTESKRLFYTSVGGNAN